MCECFVWVYHNHTIFFGNFDVFNNINKLKHIQNMSLFFLIVIEKCLICQKRLIFKFYLIKYKKFNIL